MSNKNKWAESITCKNIIITVILITGAAYGSGASHLMTDIGPDGYAPEYDKFKTVFPPSCNPDEMNLIKELLESYKFKDGVFKNENFDCSNASEAIWYILESKGYNCSLVGNVGTYNNETTYHMFVWAHLSDGVIIIEPTYQAEPDKRIGLVLENVSVEDDKFYLSGWMFGDPVQFIEETDLTDDMRPITTSTPIETLEVEARYRDST